MSSFVTLTSIIVSVDPYFVTKIADVFRVKSKNHEINLTKMHYEISVKKDCNRFGRQPKYFSSCWLPRHPSLLINCPPLHFTRVGDTIHKTRLHRNPNFTFVNS